MPELEREDELAQRRDLISRRRQKADLEAMVRNQQMAGRKAQKSKVAPKKSRKLKKASTKGTSGKKKPKGDSDDEDAEFMESDDEDELEEEEEESDYEVTTRKGSRASQRAQLHRLKKSRAKAAGRKGGAGSDVSSSEESSEYDEDEAEFLYARKLDRDRQMRSGARHLSKRDLKRSREDERLQQGKPYTIPELTDVNAARVRRDQFARLIHRPEWIDQLSGKFTRINYSMRNAATGKLDVMYRMVQIGEGHPGEEYYEVAEQYTNIVFTMLYGGEKLRNVPLRNISNSPIGEEEYERWKRRIDEMGDKARKLVPSKELTQDQAEEFEAFIDRPFTEQDITQIITQKKQAKDAYLASQEARKHAQSAPKVVPASHNGKLAVVDEVTMAQMNERHRRADRERIAEAERRKAQMLRSGSHSGVASARASGANTPIASANGHTKEASQPIQADASLITAALDIDVDLGDF